LVRMFLAGSATNRHTPPIRHGGTLLIAWCAVP